MVTIKAERIEEEDKVTVVGLKEPYWYRVKLSNGKIVLEHASNLYSKDWWFKNKATRIKR